MHCRLSNTISKALKVLQRFEVRLCFVSFSEPKSFALFDAPLSDITGGIKQSKRSRHKILAIQPPQIIEKYFNTTQEF